MIERFYINGLDAYSKFRVVIPSGGFSELLAFPEMKGPKKNDWPEHDGIEVDLSAPVLAVKEVRITFVAANPLVDPAEFLYYLSTRVSHDFKIMNRTWRLRVLSQEETVLWDNAAKFTLTFVEDNPIRHGELNIPSPGINIPDSEYKLDNIPLCRYGVVIKDGLDELFKIPAVKKNLTRSFSLISGQHYDDAGGVYFNSKESTFKCCLIAADLTRLWVCYDSFFGNLVSPDEKYFYSEYTGEDYPVYYRSTGNFKIISLSPVVAVEFDLTLVFTVFRIGQTEYLLCNTAGEYLVLNQDDEETFIDMAKNG